MWTSTCIRQPPSHRSAKKAGASSPVPTEEVALLEFFGTMRGSVHVAFEEGTQA
jgi:hypothetical protein